MLSILNYSIIRANP